MGLVGFTLGEADAAANPFFLGGLGSLAHAYKSDDFPASEETWTGPAAAGGAGVAFPVGPARGMVAGSYHQGFGDNVGDTSFVLFGAAIQVAVGQR